MDPMPKGYLLSTLEVLAFVTDHCCCCQLSTVCHRKTMDPTPKGYLLSTLEVLAFVTDQCCCCQLITVCQRQEVDLMDVGV